MRYGNDSDSFAGQSGGVPFFIRGIQKTTQRKIFVNRLLERPKRFVFQQIRYFKIFSFTKCVVTTFVIVRIALNGLNHWLITGTIDQER